MTDNIAENIDNILSQIRKIEKEAGRMEGSVKLLAVSKFHPEQAVLEAIKAGQYMFGENRVQEAYSKFPGICEKFPQTELHIIGQLQLNKVKKAVEIASCIESVDRLELLQEIEKQCSKIGKNIKILFEYHTGEESKSGFTSYESMLEAVEYCSAGNAPHIIPSGFMTMAPFTAEEKKIRQSFSTMRETAEKIRSLFPQFNMDTLSMGMSGDFRTAIQEGSTEVRIGTAIFGEREYSAK